MLYCFNGLVDVLGVTEPDDGRRHGRMIKGELNGGLLKRRVCGQVCGKFLRPVGVQVV